METANPKTKTHQIHITHARCKGCGLCVEFCPQHILFQAKETNSKGYRIVNISDIEKCKGCGLCSMYCPEFAIWVKNGKE